MLCDQSVRLRRKTLVLLYEAREKVSGLRFRVYDVWYTRLRLTGSRYEVQGLTFDALREGIERKGGIRCTVYTAST